jgi:hypothetical protein
MSDFAPIEAVAAIMDGFARPWFVSGGWAIDLFLGQVTRDHEDVELGIARADQAALHAHLNGWSLSKAISGEWIPWSADERLELPVFQVRAQRADDVPDEFEFFLNEIVDGVWRSRRNQAITRPAAELALRTPGGIPFLAPEIQLLYKAKHHRPKDDHDFERARPRLSAAQRAWLKETLQACYGDDPWLAQL